MSNLSISILVGSLLLFAGAGLPANAASVFLEFSGLVVSDIGTSSPQANQFFGTNALGTSLFITELFTSPDAKITDATFQQGGPSPNSSTSLATIISSNDAAVSTQIGGAVSHFLFTPDGFSSGIAGGSDIAQGTIIIGVSKTGSTYASDLTLNFIGLPGQQGFFSSRELVLDVSPQSVVLIATPLPPALPMFASGLLALGIFGIFQRRKKRGGWRPNALSTAPSCMR